MDKLLQNKGVSLIEMLIVLLIVSIFTISIVIPRHSIVIFSNELMMHSIICQQKAFISKKDVDVSFQVHSAFFDGIEFVYPQDITCTSQAFHYNEKGNISKACSVTCTNGQEKKKIIFQLGSGRVRVDE